MSKNKRSTLLVYICSPYRGDVTSNVAAARRYCRFAVERNATPIAPHLMYPQFMDDNNPEERQTALVMGLELLSHCNEVWVFGPVVSAGMNNEIDYAEYWGVPVKYFTAECEECYPPDIPDDEEDIPF